MSLRVFVQNIFKQSYNHKMLNCCVKIINNLIFKNNYTFIIWINHLYIDVAKTMEQGYMCHFQVIDFCIYYLMLFL